VILDQEMYGLFPPSERIHPGGGNESYNVDSPDRWYDYFMYFLYW